MHAHRTPRYVLKALVVNGAPLIQDAVIQLTRTHEPWTLYDVLHVSVRSDDLSQLSTAFATIAGLGQSRAVAHWRFDIPDCGSAALFTCHGYVTAWHQFLDLEGYGCAVAIMTVRSETQQGC